MNDEQIDAMLTASAEAVPSAVTDRIRAQIRNQTAPARPLMNSAVYVASLFAVFILIGIACAVVTGFYGWQSLPVSQSAAFLAVFDVLALLGAISIERSMRPGAGVLRLLWLSLGAIALYELLVSVFFEDYSAEQFWRRGLACLGIGLLCGAVTAAPAWMIIRRGFFVEPAKTGALVGLIAGLSGWLGLTLHCPLLTVPHTGVWHALVVPVCVAAGACVGRLVRNN